MKIIGIDFSGAQYAGRNIWIAEADFSDSLDIKTVERSDRLLGARTGRDHILPALVEYIAAQTDSVVGLDFPFSVPAKTMFSRPWERFATELGKRFPGPAEMQTALASKAGGKEIRRNTENVSRTPFASYNLRIRSQTYYGISRVIAPLIESDRAAFPPMTPVDGRKPSVVEICPASTLKELGQSTDHYKEKETATHVENRRRLLDATRSDSLVKSIAAHCEEAALSDKHGDALDAIVAAVATARAAKQIAAGEIQLHGPVDEGHVFY